MAINTAKDKPQSLLSKIFSDENAVARGVKDLAAIFYDVAAAPINLNIALVKAAANSNLPGLAIPAAIAPAATLLALTAPAGLTTIAVGYAVVCAVANFGGNLAGFVAMEGEETRAVYSAIYPNTVKRVDANRQRKLAAR